MLGALLLIGLVIPLTSCNTSPSLTSIQVTPNTVTATAGATVQFTAIGSYTHPNHPAVTKDLTDQVTWASSSDQMVTVSSTGLATTTGLSTGLVQISASMQGFNGLITGSANMTVTPSTTGGGGAGSSDITSVSIIPATATVATLNQTTQFIAIGTTAGGSSVDVTNQATWTSSNKAIATITNSGLATALASGSTIISAVAKNADGTVGTGTATFTVAPVAPSGSPEPLVSLAIVPTAQTALAIGQSAQFIAIGTTSSGTTVDLTSQSATFNGVTINAANWTSSNLKIARMDAPGLATAVGPGTAAITAIATNPDGTVVTGSASFTVTVPAITEPLVSLAIVPSTQTALAIGQTAQFIAIGTTSSGATVNLTNQSATIGTVTINAAVWSSSAVQVAKIDPASGIATALSTGVSAITAIVNNPDGTVVTGTATYTVTVPGGAEPLVSLAIVPSSQTASSVNETAQFLAIGTTGTGTTVDLTNQVIWRSSDTDVAYIGLTTGLATAQKTGVTAITATATNPDGTVVTGTATYTVSITSVTEPIISLSIDPTSQTILGLTQKIQFIALGTTSANTSVNLTNQTATVGTATINPAVWSSSNPTVAQIDPNTGIATPYNSGVTTITAIVTNPDGTVVTATSALTVNIPTTPEPIVSVSITPASQTASSLQDQAQYIAIGTTDTGTTVNLTDQTATVGTATINPAVWSSSDTTVAKIGSATGLAIPYSSGTTAITAIVTNPDGTVVTATVPFTVAISTTQEPLLSLAVIPTTQTVLSTNETAQFLAIGTFSGTGAQLTPSMCGSTGTTQDCTDYVTWISSDVKVATINTTGLATGLNVGTTAITAIAKNPDGTLVTGAAAFTEQASGGGTQQSNLTVVLMGANAANGTVTIASPVSTTTTCSATNPSGCAATLPLGTVVTLTAVPINGATFSGWSVPCNGSGTTCTTTLTDNETVAAIFN